MPRLTDHAKDSLAIFLLWVYMIVMILLFLAGAALCIYAIADEISDHFGGLDA